MSHCSLHVPHPGCSVQPLQGAGSSFTKETLLILPPSARNVLFFLSLVHTCPIFQISIQGSSPKENLFRFPILDYCPFILCAHRPLPPFTEFRPLGNYMFISEIISLMSVSPIKYELQERREQVCFTRHCIFRA